MTREEVYREYLEGKRHQRECRRQDTIYWLLSWYIDYPYRNYWMARRLAFITKSRRVVKRCPAICDGDPELRCTAVVGHIEADPEDPWHTVHGHINWPPLQSGHAK